MPIVYSKETKQWTWEGGDPEEAEVLLELGLDEFVKRFGAAVFKQSLKKQQEESTLEDIPVSQMPQA